MTLPSRFNARFKADDQLLAMAEWPDLRVEKVKLEAGHLNPVTFHCHEIGFMLAGRTITRYSGRGVQHRSLICPGTARICPAGTFEKDVVIEKPIECMLIALAPTLIEASALADYDIDPSKAELAYVGGLIDPTLQRICLSLLDVLSRETVLPTDRMFVEGMQVALAAHLLGTYSIDRWRRPVTTPQIDLRRLARVLDYIDAHYPENIALRDLAAEARLSPYYFARLFQEATGTTPHRYLTLRRVEAAKAELMRGHASMTEIAQATGLGSQTNFIRVFVKATGMTPGRFRGRRFANK